MRAVQVMQMFDKAEAEFRELSDKRVIVENDKSKIQKVPPQPVQLQQPACAQNVPFQRGQCKGKGTCEHHICGWWAGAQS